MCGFHGQNRHFLVFRGLPAPDGALGLPGIFESTPRLVPESAGYKKKPAVHMAPVPV